MVHIFYNRNSPVYFSVFLFPSMIDQRLFLSDYGLNLMSECWGLLFTLIFFVGIFDLRELLEWKGVEKKVNERIGRQIKSLYQHLVYQGIEGTIIGQASAVPHFEQHIEESKNNFLIDPGKYYRIQSGRLLAYLSRIEVRRNTASSYE